jgi:hypothetical protein
MLRCGDSTLWPRTDLPSPHLFSQSFLRKIQEGVVVHTLEHVMLARLLALFAVLAAISMANAESSKEARTRLKSESSDQVRTRLWAESFRGEYFKCLAKEMEQAVRLKLSEEEFALIIKDFCPEEIQQFRLAFVHSTGTLSDKRLLL